MFIGQTASVFDLITFIREKVSSQRYVHPKNAVKRRDIERTEAAYKF
jgi:hypothetical protein